MKVIADSHTLSIQPTLLQSSNELQKAAQRGYSTQEQKFWILPKLVLESQNRAYQYNDQKNDPIF